MEYSNPFMRALDLLREPAFVVADRKIQYVNEAAEKLFLAPQMSILPLISAGSDEYQSYSQGCLYLTIKLDRRSYDAAVIREKGMDLFTLEPTETSDELRALSLAAVQLRQPLSSILATAELLFPSQVVQSDPDTRKQAAQMNRSLHQLMRALGNMADAADLSEQPPVFEDTNISSFWGELMEKTSVLAAASGVRLDWQLPEEAIFGQIDRELLERALYNLLSNALKYTPVDSTIFAKLARSGSKLQLSIQDQGPGLSQQIRGTVFSRYLRQPGLEDSRSGIGLGMTIVRRSVSAHGGSVLLDQPQAPGLRVTITIPLRQGNTLQSTRVQTDYSGELDHSLIELADVLPIEHYQQYV